MKNFRTLDLAVELSDLVSQIDLQGHMKDQLARAVTSIALNLAEGNARPTSKDKKRFYLIAYSSLKECQTIFRLIKMTDEKILSKADHLGACLYKLSQAHNPVVLEQKRIQSQIRDQGRKTGQYSD